MLRFFRHTLFAWIWALVVLFIHAVPGKDIPQVDFWARIGFDKLVHLIVFMLLSLFFCVGFKKQTEYRWLHQKALRVVVLSCIAYGGLLEWLQHTVFVDRFADWIDMLANTSGAILGAVIFRLIYGKELSQS